MAVATAADMRFATEDQFGIPAARLSIAYGYDGRTTGAHLIGPAMASEIMFTARRVQPDEAQRIGLINRAVPVDELEAAVREGRGRDPPQCACRLQSSSLRSAKF